MPTIKQVMARQSTGGSATSQFRKSAKTSANAFTSYTALDSAKAFAAAARKGNKALKKELGAAARRKSLGGSGG